MSKYDNQQNDMMFRIKNLLTTEWKDMKINPVHVDALNLFTTDEIIETPFANQAVFEQQQNLTRFDENPSNEALSSQKNFIHLLHVRVIEHNIRIVSKYYQRIRLSRLQTLLSLSLEDLETRLSDLSFSGDIYLKIDRPNGIVSFEKKRSCEEVLSEWSNDISKMMQLMETTCHLVNRENMVHKV
jgi:26S proteasome regulatory subunit N5